MAQLKDTTISGSLRVTDNIYSITNQFKILNAPTTADGDTYGPGSNGQILVSNGSSVYWRNTYNRESAGGLQWANKATDGLYLLTKNAIAYWDGTYNGTVSNLTKLGTITQGTWNASVIGIQYGGTGANSAAKAKENLGLGSEPQNFSVVNNGGDEQHWGLRAVVQNNANGTKHYVGRQNTLILLDTGLLAYSSLPSNPSTINNNIWSLGLDSSDNLHYFAAIPPVNINENNATNNRTRMSVNLYHTGNVIYSAENLTGTYNEGTIWLQPI